MKVSDCDYMILLRGISNNNSFKKCFVRMLYIVTPYLAYYNWNQITFFTVYPFRLIIIVCPRPFFLFYTLHIQILWNSWFITIISIRITSQLSLVEQVPLILLYIVWSRYFKDTQYIGQRKSVIWKFYT